MAESLNSTIPVTPNVPLRPLVGFPGRASIAFEPVLLTTLKDKVPLTPFLGAKYATAPLFPVISVDEILYTSREGSYQSRANQCQITVRIRT
jgi:hypothetical protein